MHDAVQIQVDDERVGHLQGDLSFQTVTALLSEINKLHTKTPLRALDLQAIRRTDTAGLALLIELLRMTRQDAAPLYFYNLPAQLLRLAEVSGVTALLSEHHVS